MLVAEDVREHVSEITEMTDDMVVPAFDWERDYGALYRDCPSAFWLAPDGSRQIVAVEEPRRPQVLHVEPLPQALELPRVTGLVGGASLSLLLAGPLFLSSAMLLEGFEHGVTRAIIGAMASAFAAPFTIPVGVVLGLLPITLGVSVLSHLGIDMPAVRRSGVWTSVGAVMGLCLAAMFDAGAPVGAALIATSAACARIARILVEWHDPDVI